MVERDEQSHHIYFRSKPNPSLTHEFQALVARALPPTAGAASPQVDCRAFVCRVQLAGRKTNDPEDPWVRQLENDPGVRGKIGRKGLFPDFMLYEFGPGARPPVAPAMAPTRAEGRLKEAWPTAMLAAVDVAGCAKRFPATGTMKVVVNVYPVGIDRSGRLDRFEVALEGPLADTPLGRCVREGVAVEARKAPIPPDFRGYVRRKLDFPLTPP